FSLAGPEGRDGKPRHRKRRAIHRRAKLSARLMGRVSEAVHHAHQYRLLHRDLKPGNILIDGREHPYVADFGLVMRIDEQDVVGSPPAGTWAYMAPEQARGELLSTAVDEYGLGAILD